MSVPIIHLTQIELALLTSAIDAYVMSLCLPEIFPEHMSQHKHILHYQRSVFFSLATANHDFDLVMTEATIIAVDESVLGFMQICERMKKGVWSYPQALNILERIHDKLEQMKLPSIGQ